MAFTHCGKTAAVTLALSLSLSLSTITAHAATISLKTSTDLSPLPLCSDSQTTTDVASGLTMSDTCTPTDWALTATNRARASWGPSGLSLGSSVSVQALGTVDVVDSESFARFTDIVTLTGGAPGTSGFLNLQLDIEGSVFSPASRFGGATASLSYFGTLTGPTHASVNIPFIFGQPGTLQLQLATVVFMYDMANFPASTFFSSADFYDTVTLTGTRVLDANGNVIPDGSVISASDLRYPGAPQPVPEPATALLVAVGLVGTAAARRPWLRGRR
jgi:hypothetical protein